MGPAGLAALAVCCLLCLAATEPAVQPIPVAPPPADPLAPLLDGPLAVKAVRKFNQGLFGPAAELAGQALREEKASGQARVALRFLRALARVRAGRDADAADLIAAMDAEKPSPFSSHAAWYMARQLWDRGLGDSERKANELARPYLERVGFPGRFGLEARARLIRGLQAGGRLEDACVLAEQTRSAVYRRLAEAQALLTLASCRERAAWVELRAGERTLARQGLSRAAGLYRVVAVLWPESWAGPVAKKNLDRLVQAKHKPILPQADLLQRARDIVERPMGLRDQRVLWRVRSLLPWDLRTPAGAEAELLWAEMSTRHRRFNRAWRSASRVMKKSKDPELRARAGLLLARLTARRRSAQAIDLFRDVARKWPRSQVAAEALFQAGEISRRHGRAELADTLFAACTQGHGEQAAAGLCRWGLAWSAFRRGDVDRALAWIGPLTEGRDLVGAAPALVDLIEEEGAEEEGVEDEAEAAAEQGHELGPNPTDDPEDEFGEVRRQAYRLRQRARYWQARFHELRGQTDAALSGYRRVMEEHPFSYYALLAWQRLAGLGQAPAVDSGGAELEQPGDALHPEVAMALAYYRLGLLGECRATLLALRRTDLEHGIDRRFAALLRERLGDYTRSHRMAPVPRDGGLPDYPARGWRADAQLAYPRAFSEVIEGQARDPGVPIMLLYALIRVESGFWAEARSPANARGLTQVITSTAWAMAKKLKLKRFRRWKLYQPEMSVQVGSAYLGALLKRYGHPALAIAAYNAGERAVDRWVRLRGQLPLDAFVEEIPYEETARYTRRVLSWWAIYRTLYEPEPPAPPLSTSWSLGRTETARR